MQLSSGASCVVVGVASLLGAGPARATTTVYTNQAAFLAQLGTHASDDFNDLARGDVQLPTFTRGVVNGYRVTYAGPPDGLYNSAASMSTNSAFESLVLTFDSGNVTAVGGSFYDSDQLGVPVSGTVTVTLADATTTTFLAGGATFRGFVSDAPITSLTVTTTQIHTTSEYVWPTVDDLSYGAAIPEPTGPVMTFAGMLASITRRTGRSRSRRKRSWAF
jgi:hypothetical protein